MSTWSEENERLRLELQGVRRQYRDAVEERDAYSNQLEDARASLHTAAETINEALDRVQPLIFASHLSVDTSDQVTMWRGLKATET